MPPGLFKFHDQEFSAPDCAIITQARAVKAEGQGRAVVAVFGQNGRCVGGVVLQAPQGQAFALSAGLGIAGGKKIGMCIAHQSLGVHLQQLFQMRGHLLIKT